MGANERHRACGSDNGGAEGNVEMSLEIIKALVDELTALYVTPGVQPGDLADNIFEDSYVESVSRKTTTGAIFEITFEKLDEDARGESRCGKPMTATAT